jgi:hypothetical protein
MIKFKQKEYTLQEGHYTGTKSIKKVPGAIKVIFKSVLSGMGIGAGVGAVVPEETVGTGAKKGAKAGFWAGVALKILIDKFHKPMSSVKFQKVDQAIRKEYGIREVSGMIVGDTKEKRDNLNSHFAFNNSEVFKFKINVLILKKRVTLYLADLNKKDLDLLNESLDYYCYKYHGMEYSSKLLNQKRNSYSVTIVFTNYDAIAKFLIEISNSLETRINVLDKEANLEEMVSKDKEKTFSILSKNSSLPTFDKYDMIKILGKGGTIIKAGGFKTKAGDYIMDSLSAALLHAKDVNKAEARGVSPFKRKELGNHYLEKAFKDLGFKEGKDYTVGKNTGPFNMYLHEGYLIICSGLNGSLFRKFDSKILRNYKFSITTVNKNATLYSYKIGSNSDLDQLLRDIVNLNIKPNIYTR